MTAPFLDGVVTTAVDITLLRGRLHRELLRRQLPTRADEDGAERLLLAFEELASNGLRHGAPPVSVSVSQGDGGWLITVSDGASERTPTPDVDRDPADGGLGLYLVARLSAAYGWCTRTGRKDVWASVRTATAT
ncbi:ATP-binding protein [Geodermatophilus amargosae]|uniref:ATP-binding protein n=1 Tax=Geodermatophilus amargosae TaxID=1296565 RepID=UPI0034DF7775